jgi:integrase
MAVYRDKRRSTRPWVIDISYIDRRTGERARYFRNASLQTSAGARPPLQRILEEAKERRSSLYVAPSGRRAPWTRGGLRHAFDRAVERAKLPHTRLHDLRHFFITQCFAGGAGGPTVQKLAGHCNLSVTQRYAHTDALMMRQAVQVFGSRSG